LADAGCCFEENLAAIDDDLATRNVKKNQSSRIGRRGPLKHNAMLVEKMDRKLSNKAGRALYRKRQQITEPVFGPIKDGRHIRGFMRRGEAAAASEWKLICGAYNLLKLYHCALSDAGAVPYSRMATMLTR